MVNVKISEKGGQQSNYEFDKPEVTIGRMKGNDIVLPKGNVSKKHARIYRRNGALLIDDLDSTNGTYVNGRKVDSDHEIADNDKIYIGDFILQVTEGQQAQQGSGPPQPPGSSEAEPRSSQSAAAEPAPADLPDQTNPPPGGSNPSGAGPEDPPPSPPDPEGGGDPLSSLDEKYGGGDGDSSPESAGRSSQSQPVAGASSGAAPSDVDGGRSRNSSASRSAAASNPSRGEPDSHATRRGQQEEVRAEGPPSHEPGPSDRSASTPGTPPAGGGSSGTPADASPGSGAPPSQPDRAPSDADRPSGGPAAQAPEIGGGGQRRAEAGELDGEAPADAAGHAIVPPQLESEFDEDFWNAQQEVVDALLQRVAPAELPLAYPPEQADREEYRTIVRDTVREIKPRRVDREQLIEVFTDECVALGPLEIYLDDPAVQNIFVNQFDRIVLRRDRNVVVGPYGFSHPDFLQAAVWRLLGTREPGVITDEIRFGDGTRVQVTLPPVSVDGPVLTVRKPPARHPSLEDLVADGVVSEGMGRFLARAVESGRSILVAGPVSSGKTTLLEALGGEIPEAARTIVVEETTQLELPQQGVVRLEARAEAGYELEQLLDAAVEMHPDRLLLDECRGAEAYTWVSSVATGTDGSMATLHGVDASDALGRLESLSLLGSGDISPRGLREQIARAVDLVVVINRSNDGQFRVQQVAELQGVDLDAFRLNDIFYYRVDGSSGAFHPTGYIPLFYEDLRHLGMDVDLDIFRE